MEPLKNTYNKKFIADFSITIKQVMPGFNSQLFTDKVFDDNWKKRELKQRMRHITLSLNNQLPTNYNDKIDIVLKIINKLDKNQVKGQSFEWMFLPEFLELYGLDNLETSTIALEKITQFTSCEFAVRPFIVKYPEKMMHQMLIWSKHKNKHVRRFSSEACRPRLPWAMALPKLKKDPKNILPILENLKNDESEYVRRSVANNLNDIAKDNPKTVIKIAKKWIDKTKETDKLIKHACRTLLKQGNIEVMTLFGFDTPKNIIISSFKIQNTNIKIGDYLDFSFKLENKGHSKIKLRLEYAIYYQKANGILTKKVYKISEKEYKEKSINPITKKQSFKPISTRKFHFGLHQIAVIINGVEYNKNNFYLKT